jgi:hypothetical protein
MIAGFAVLGAGYVASALSYALGSSFYKPTLVIPIAGPWIALGNSPWETVNMTLRPVDQAAMVLQGLLQATGLLLSVIGIARYSASSDAAARTAPNVEFGFVPAPTGIQTVLRLQL